MVVKGPVAEVTLPPPDDSVSDREAAGVEKAARRKAFESASTVLIVGFTILLVSFLAGMLPDDIVAFLLQLLVVVGAVIWGVRTYFVARAEIKNGITPACSAAETPAVRFVTARTSGWRFRFFSRAYAEQFAAANRGGAITTLYD